MSERTASWVKIGKIQTETLQKSVITLRAPDVIHPHSAFGRYREFVPEEVNYTKIAIRVTVMNKVQFLLALNHANL